MYAQIKQGKLVRLTAEFGDAQELLSKGVIDGVYTIENLSDVAKLLDHSKPHGKSILQKIKLGIEQVVKKGKSLPTSTPPAPTPKSPIDPHSL